MTNKDIFPDVQELAAEHLPVSADVSDSFVLQSIHQRAQTVLPPSLDESVFQTIVDQTSSIVLASKQINS